MNQLELLRAMAKAGFRFGKDDYVGTYLIHDEIYRTIQKVVEPVWGEQLPYYFVQPDLFVFEFPEGSLSIQIEDDEHDIQKLLLATFNAYTEQ